MLLKIVNKAFGIVTSVIILQPKSAESSNYERLRKNFTKAFNQGCRCWRRDYFPAGDALFCFDDISLIFKVCLPVSEG